MTAAAAIAMAVNKALGTDTYRFDGLDQLQTLLESTVLKSPSTTGA
jgi:hypothetical protein